MKFKVRLKRWEEQDFKTVEVVAKDQQSSEDKAEAETGFSFFAIGSEVVDTPKARMAKYIRTDGYRK